jgi:predicted DNA-binding transcriptional regulator AlpA
MRRTLRRNDLRLIVPLADTTIYEMERRGEFPRRFNLTPRCVVRDLTEVEAWIEQRRNDSDARLVSVARRRTDVCDGRVRSNCTRKLTGRRGSAEKYARCDNSSAVGRAIRGFIICPADLQIRLDSLLGISSSQSHPPRG